MNEQETYHTYEDWLASRPASVQALAKRFPIPGRIIIDGTAHYILGYSEPDGLILSPINPGIDYHGARANLVEICGDCLNDIVPMREGL